MLLLIYITSVGTKSEKPGWVFFAIDARRRHQWIVWYLRPDKVKNINLLVTDGACHLETAMITIVHENVPPASIPMVDWCFGFNDTFGTIALYRGC